jgi:hypothetical protein
VKLVSAQPAPLWRASHGDPDLKVERFVESRAMICRNDDLLSQVCAH